MAVEKSVVFRIILYVCGACVVVSFLFYTTMPLQTVPDSYGTKMPIPALVPDSKEVVSSGLYTKSKLIDELNAHTYKFVKEGKAPALILYYASWCGHCRQFAPVYESLANTTLSKIAKLNNDHRQSTRGRRSYVNKPYTSLHFTAIDCGEFSSLCSKESITSYPTLVMLNVKHAAEKVVGPNLKSATKFVNEKYFAVQDRELDAATGDSPGRSAAGYQYLPKTSKRAFDATAQQRFDDALASLDYLLLRELPREWTANHTTALLKFLRVFTDLYPTSSSPRAAVVLPVYEKLIKLVEADAASPGKFLTDKIINLVGKSRPGPQWAFCAVVSNSTLSEQPTPPRSLKASANLRGNTAVSAATNANSTVGSIVAHRSDGYPCGLWFLFHYMTVVSGDARYRYKYGAAEVLLSIYDLAKHFFACYDCRAHFMSAYDDCAFDRCSIGDTDYDKAQLWLYHQHNAVTQRVWAEETATATSSPNSAKDMLRSELWPSQGQCETCIGAPSTGEVPGTSVNSGDTANSSAGESANTIVGGAGSSSQGYDPQSVDGAAVLRYLHTAYFV